MNDEIKPEVVVEATVVSDSKVENSTVQSAPIDQLKLWKGISLMLAIAVVGMIVKPIAKVDQATKSPEEAGASFIETVNKVYAPSVTNAVLGSVEEQHGMYLVKFKVDLDGETMDQETYLSTDGEYIIPQAIAISDIIAQYEMTQAVEAAAAAAMADETSPDSDDQAAAQ
jgi:hypothetical protein